MNPKDTILQELTPVVPVPRFEALAPSPSDVGHRFLVAGDGLWVEAGTPWLRARMPLSRSSVALPFGAIESVLEFKCGKLPRTLFQAFIETAREASPKETAAIITWHCDTGEFRLVSIAVEAGKSHVRYERPRLAEGEFLVVDMHSHGTLPACFSAQDDADDFGEIKLAVVVGHCDTEAPEVTARLCLLGLYIPLPQVIAPEARTQPEAHADEA